MEILPFRTAPSPTAIERRHQPTRGSFPTYQSCLRWEFGFSCAFCLVHEADLNEHDLGGLGLMWTEHHVPQSDDAGLANSYRNCFYSCRFCNRARANAPTHSEGRQLLDPCTVAWGRHFTLDENLLVPRSSDSSAQYTEEIYRINAPSRILLRHHRAVRLAEAFRVLQGAPNRTQMLLSVARTLSAETAQMLLDAAEDLSRWVQHARQQLRRYRAIPASAPTHCRCSTKQHCTLPDFLRDHVLLTEDV